ncbi:hypothetical protein, partial [Micromonospora chokoriensis]
MARRGSPPERPLSTHGSRRPDRDLHRVRLDHTRILRAEAPPPPPLFRAPARPAMLDELVLAATIAE